MSTALVAQPLSREAFAPFGDVIETERAEHYTINAGWAERFHDLAALDVAATPGRPGLSIFRAKPRPQPAALTLIERHLQSSQAFMPLGRERFLIVVAAPGPAPTQAEQLRVFISDGAQGVNYRAGTWHHPLIAIGQEADFLIVDRIGAPRDCEDIDITPWGVTIAAV